MSATDDAWPEEALDYVQAIADTKLVLGFRYAERMASGQSIEDDVANMNLAQEEFGHVRQLYGLLSDQGREREWLEHDRDPGMYANASPLDEPIPDWTSFVVTTGLVDRAAWLLTDAIAHPDLDGIREKIAQEEAYHLERADAWLEQLAEDDPEAVEAAIADALPGVLALVGPAEFDETTDPLVEAGFTDAPVAQRRDRLLSHYRALLEDTDVSLDAADTSGPDRAEWDPVRRRVSGGSLPTETVEVLQGTPNEEFAVA
ncbi:MAG: Phenylacetic acid catabolic protein [Haloferacaceae archaeon]